MSINQGRIKVLVGPRHFFNILRGNFFKPTTAFTLFLISPLSLIFDLCRALFFVGQRNFAQFAIWLIQKCHKQKNTFRSKFWFWLGLLDPDKTIKNWINFSFFAITTTTAIEQKGNALSLSPFFCCSYYFLFWTKDDHHFFLGRKSQDANQL